MTAVNVLCTFQLTFWHCSLWSFKSIKDKRKSTTTKTTAQSVPCASWWWWTGFRCAEENCQTAKNPKINRYGMEFETIVVGFVSFQFHLSESQFEIKGNPTLNRVSSATTIYWDGEKKNVSFNIDAIVTGTPQHVGRQYRRRRRSRQKKNDTECWAHANAIHTAVWCVSCKRLNRFQFKLKR